METGRAADWLQATAADGAWPDTGVAFRDSTDGLARILRSFDATVLPRWITVAVSGQPNIDVAVANRCVMSATGAAGPPLDGRALSAEHADAVLDALAIHCAAPGRLWLRQAPATLGAGSAAVGLPVRVLRDRLQGPAPAPPDLLTRIEGFVQDPRLRIRAAIWIPESAPQPLAGSAEDIRALMAWAEPRLDQMLAEGFPLAGSFATQGAFVFAGSGARPHHVLLAGHCGAAFAADMHGSDLAASLTAWQATRAAR